MLDQSLIATLEQSLQQTRNAQNRLMLKLREAEAEVANLRMEIGALENSAVQTGKAIDSLLVTMRSSSNPGLGRNLRLEDDNGFVESPVVDDPRKPSTGNQVAYMSGSRHIPSITQNAEAITNRFGDRTITQACTLLLREAGGPLHVNELYNLLIAGGMKFKGNNPTISIAVSLNRNRRFRKVDPGTFDLIMREAIQAAS
jgi:hypothetical protein